MLFSLLKYILITLLGYFLKTLQIIYLEKRDKKNEVKEGLPSLFINSTDNASDKYSGYNIFNIYLADEKELVYEKLTENELEGKYFLTIEKRHKEFIITSILMDDYQIDMSKIRDFFTPVKEQENYENIIVLNDSVKINKIIALWDSIEISFDIPLDIKPTIIRAIINK